jgi:DNA-binding CsgD family transcriptional regulator/tetratricopeptide (TPR) repeat protein
MVTAPARPVGPALVGREAEQAEIEGVLCRARAGRGGGAVLWGEPGIGKTALLDHAAAQAAGMRVLYTAGVEPEAGLGYSALHRMLRPVLDGVGALPGPQANALEVVLGQATGPAPDRFLVALGVLSLLSAVADDPVLCLVDDLHRVDPPSREVLLFVARRLDAEPIAMVMATRPDGRADIDGLHDIRLAGLDPAAARTLLEPGLSPGAQERVLAATGGNPLALRELSTSAIGFSDGPAPIATGLRWAFLERARHHAAPAQRLLLLIAADGTGAVPVLGRAAAASGVHGVPGPALDDLADLVEVRDATVTFRHPLMRAAVYHEASPAERRAAHRALAAALDGEPTCADRRAWHLGQATEGVDEEVAAELERSAQRAQHRAGPAAVAAALTRAAELTAPGAVRAGRLVRAGRAWWDGGDLAAATRRLTEAEREVAAGSPAAVDLAALRALIELRAGVPSEAVELLRPVVAAALAGERRGAIEVLMLLGEASYHADSARGWADVAENVEQLGPTGDGPRDALTRLVRGTVRVRGGRDAGLAPDDLDAVERLVTDPRELCWAGGLCYGLGEQERGRRLRRAAMVRARSLGAVGTLAWVLSYVVSDGIAMGRYDLAEAHADEGRRHADETGQPNLDLWFLGSLATIAAVRGREGEARDLAATVLAGASVRDLAAPLFLARRALGLLDLAAGRWAAAMEHLRPAAPLDNSHPGLMIANIGDLVEAAVRCGRADEVAVPLRSFLRWADATRSPSPGAIAARCRAMRTSGPAAEAEFRTALAAHDRGGWPLEQARTQLLLGEHLRRERRRADARVPLRAALATFERLGAPAWADRAREELRATGEAAAGAPAANVSVPTLAQLTPQELRIALAVGEGASNREVAAGLFLSPRTVDYHLRKIFQKTSISSRSDLIRMVLATAGATH